MPPRVISVVSVASPFRPFTRHPSRLRPGTTAIRPPAAVIDVVQVGRARREVRSAGGPREPGRIEHALSAAPEPPPYCDAHTLHATPAHRTTELLSASPSPPFLERTRPHSMPCSIWSSAGASERASKYCALPSSGGAHRRTGSVAARTSKSITSDALAAATANASHPPPTYARACATAGPRAPRARATGCTPARCTGQPQRASAASSRPPTRTRPGGAPTHLASAAAQRRAHAAESGSESMRPASRLYVVKSTVPSDATHTNSRPSRPFDACAQKSRRGPSPSSAPGRAARSQYPHLRRSGRRAATPDGATRQDAGTPARVASAAALRPRRARYAVAPRALHTCAARVPSPPRRAAARGSTGGRARVRPLPAGKGNAVDVGRGEVEEQGLSADRRAFTSHASPTAAFPRTGGQRDSLACGGSGARLAPRTRRRCAASRRWRASGGSTAERWC